MPSLLGEIPPELRVPMPRHPSPEGATYPRIGPWSYPEAPPPAPVLNQLIQDGGEANHSFGNCHFYGREFREFPAADGFA
jgi:hypothetical protein